MEHHLINDIRIFEETVNDTLPTENQPTNLNTRIKTEEQIIKLIKENPNHTTKSLAQSVGISPKGIEKQLSKLKAKGLIKRIGTNRGGYWEVTDKGKSS